MKKEYYPTLETLDYNLSTRILSEQTGIPRRYITEARKEFGKGRATIYSPQQKPRKMKLDPRNIDWQRPTKDIANEAGVSVQRVYQLKKKLLQQQCSSAA